MELCSYNHFIVYGSADFKCNSRLQAQDIINNIPAGSKCIWLRDESHIKTNKFSALLEDYCFKIINFSATTDTNPDITCKFTHTCMLRTPQQSMGTPEDAILKLIEVKKQHNIVKNYNPCAIFRLASDNSKIYEIIISLCDKYNLKYINLIGENHDIMDLCRDDNPYDVIIQKFKIVEGIDIRRAHVLYLDNAPGSTKTVIQSIGRCRRNALIYRDDIDVFEEKHKKLFKDTSVCYVYYNVDKTAVHVDDDGELSLNSCDIISVQDIKCGVTVHVEDGKMTNGLTIHELENLTGDFEIIKDEQYGFNIVVAKNNSVIPFYYDEKTYICDDGYLVSFGETYIGYYNTDACKFSKRISHVICPPTLESFFKEHNMYCTGYVVPLIKFRYCKISETGQRLYEAFKVTEKVTKFNWSAGKFETHIGDYFNIDITRLYRYFLKHIKKFSSIKSNSFLMKQHINKDMIIIAEEFYNWSRQFIQYLESDVRCVNVKKCEHTALYVNELYSYHPNFYPYYSITNNREMSIIGFSNMKPITDKDEVTGNTVVKFIEDRSVTSQLGKNTKFNRFIQQRYDKYIDDVTPMLFNGKNDFSFSKKCNTMLGYCVEYYSKYLIYGTCFIHDELVYALIEAGYIKLSLRGPYKRYRDVDLSEFSDKITPGIVLRACILKYIHTMAKTFGSKMSHILPSISLTELVKQSYKPFLNTVINLAEKTASFVKNYIDPKDMYLDPRLITDHIIGLCDYVSSDTIIDIKVTSSITRDHIKQVLAYSYLSKNRSDLNIKRVIVYEAVTGRFVEITL